ncbi:MAG: polyprenyl synthetase family protein [Actinomycetota bacterium]|nr:polyprenyl synthetase family protein [Actinomycetota bacterium]
MRSSDELRAAVEEYLEALELSPELGALEDVVRYALEGGGKRIRPVLCLATAEAAGGSPADALPAGAAIELVHSFSLVHDDLPALDDDDERRGRPTAHVRFGEAQAILAGDALLAEAFRLAASCGPEVERELAAATLGMIGGQYVDVNGGPRGDLISLHRRKTGRLFEAAVGAGLSVARVPPADQEPWRTFAAEFGLLYQIVDDLLDRDGLVRERGEGATRRLAGETEDRARVALLAIDADATILSGLVSELCARVRDG